MEENTLLQWIKLHEKIKGREVRLKRFLRYAALFIIALVLGFWSNYLLLTTNTQDQQVEYKEVEATKGQVKEIFLADGTHIWLNSDSKLSFPSNFSADNRAIELSGEAFFEVATDKEKKFLVKTGKHTVEVTGTRFNVCEYPENKISGQPLKAVP